RYEHFETQTGFVVRGAAVRQAITSPRRPDTASVLEADDGSPPRPAIVRVEGPGLSRPIAPTSVALQFVDKRCVILGALPGYIGHVTVDDGGVSNVSYVPSKDEHGWNWLFYDERRKYIDRLRASVALAADHNTFHVQSKEQAWALFTKIRVGTSIDPTL